MELSLNWEDLLEYNSKKAYFKDIYERLDRAEHQGISIYPPRHLIFNALEMTPLNQVKAVISGQDPYHGPNEAHGLLFSVQLGVKIPPSIRNLLTELPNDLGISAALHGDLTPWAEQGVLLLNTSLTS